jgi:hypothetical protein
MQELTSRVEVEARIIGLRINVAKTKVMTIGRVEPGQSILANGRAIKEVTELWVASSLRTAAVAGTS